MGIAQHVYRRGGIYWWRRRGAPGCEGPGQYIHLSLKVRTPKAARILAIRVTAEAERIASLVGDGMLNPDQQKALLAVFIAEQTEKFDQIAAEVTLKNTREWEEVKEQAQSERLMSQVFATLALYGERATILKEDETKLKAKGFTENENIHIRDLVMELREVYRNFGGNYNPAEPSIGPNSDYFIDILQRQGFPVTQKSIELARRNWMRAQSQTLNATERRYGADATFRDTNEDKPFTYQRAPKLFVSLNSELASEVEATLEKMKSEASIREAADIQVAEESRKRHLATTDHEPFTCPRAPELPKSFRLELAPEVEAALEKMEIEDSIREAADFQAAEESRKRYFAAISQDVTTQPTKREPEILIPPDLQIKSEKPEVSIRDLVANLVKARQKSREWDEKTATQHESVAELFLKFIRNENPARITQAQVGGFRSMLDDLPKSHGKSARDRMLPLNAILEHGKHLPPEKVGLSPGTVNRYLTQLGTILKFARANGFDVADINMDTLKDMRPRDHEANEDKRQQFSKADLETLFRHPMWTVPEQKRKHPSLYWVPLLGVYGLGRLSELCGLMVEDIDTNPTQPALLFRGNASRRLKTKTSVRRIPIHSEIIRLGFLDYVAKMQTKEHTLLFPDLRERGSKTYLATLFDKIWVPLLDEALPGARQQAKTFHSFRKTGNTAMINGEVIDAIRLDIMGHSQKDVNTQHYKGQLSDEAKLRALAHIPVVTAHLKRID